MNDKMRLHSHHRELGKTEGSVNIRRIVNHHEDEKKSVQVK